jgi:hypothetical protein
MAMFMKIIATVSALLIARGRQRLICIRSWRWNTDIFFGATANGKWMKAEEAAKALNDETTYRIYGLTQSFGEAKGGKPKPSVTARRCGKSGDATCRRRILSEGDRL